MSRRRAMVSRTEVVSPFQPTAYAMPKKKSSQLAKEPSKETAAAAGVDGSLRVETGPCVWPK